MRSRPLGGTARIKTFAHTTTASRCAWRVKPLEINTHSGWGTRGGVADTNLGATKSHSEALRIHGLPPITLGSNVIRSSGGILSGCERNRVVNPAGSIKKNGERESLGSPGVAPWLGDRCRALAKRPSRNGWFVSAWPIRGYDAKSKRATTRGFVSTPRSAISANRKSSPKGTLFGRIRFGNA
jgi:hypothetical protein